MSFPSPCPACTMGDHPRHNRDHGIRPGLIGGTSCDCSGDCAETSQRDFEAMWGDHLDLARPSDPGCREGEL